MTAVPTPMPPASFRRASRPEAYFSTFCVAACSRPGGAVAGSWWCCLMALWIASRCKRADTTRWKSHSTATPMSKAPPWSSIPLASDDASKRVFYPAAAQGVGRQPPMGNFASRTPSDSYIFECRVRSNPKLHHSVLGTATHRALPRGTWSSRETWSSLYSRHVPDAEPDHGYRITSAEVCFRAQSFGHVFHEIKGVSVNHL